MKKASVLLAAVLAVAAVLAAEGSHLKVGYYKKSCRGVENVVKYHVARAIHADRKTGAALVRLIFHDCFVRGLFGRAPPTSDPRKTAPLHEILPKRSSSAKSRSTKILDLRARSMDFMELLKGCSTVELGGNYLPMPLVTHKSGHSHQNLNFVDLELLYKPNTP